MPKYEIVPDHYYHAIRRISDGWLLEFVHGSMSTQDLNWALRDLEQDPQAEGCYIWHAPEEWSKGDLHVKQSN